MFEIREFPSLGAMFIRVHAHIYGSQTVVSVQTAKGT